MRLSTFCGLHRDTEQFLLQVQGACQCCMYKLHPAVSPCCMSVQHVHAVIPCCMSLPFPCCMSVLHAQVNAAVHAACHAACPCWMSMPHDRAACPCRMSKSREIIYLRLDQITERSVGFPPKRNLSPKQNGEREVSFAEISAIETIDPFHFGEKNFVSPKFWQKTI